MYLPRCGLLPPLQGISLTHSLGRVPGLLGFPPASWRRAALQATRESLSWFPSSVWGVPSSRAGRCQKSQVAWGWGHGSLFPPLT